MLIEVKAKVARIIDNKVRKRTETYLIDKEFFSEAEYAVMEVLSEEQSSNLIENSEIVSLKVSPIREIYTTYEGESSFVATFKDIFLETDGTERQIKYKVLLWADNLTDAMSRANEIASQGYSMTIEGLKEVNYEYLNNQEDGQA